MGKQQLPRKPKDLRMQYPGGSFACLAAQLLYMFRLEQRPDLTMLDQEIRKVALGVSMHDADAYYYLLRRGLSYVMISAEDPQRTLRLGKLSLMAGYGAEWNGEYDKFFTPQRVREIQTYIRKDLGRLALYRKNGKAQRLQRPSTPKDVMTLLRRGYVVDATYRIPLEGIYEEAVVLSLTGDTDESMWMYRPMKPGQTVERVSLEQGLQSIRYDRWIVGLKR
jgi:hypothetical protein